MADTDYFSTAILTRAAKTALMETFFGNNEVSGEPDFYIGLFVNDILPDQNTTLDDLEQPETGWYNLDDQTYTFYPPQASQLAPTLVSTNYRWFTENELSPPVTAIGWFLVTRVNPTVLLGAARFPNPVTFQWPKDSRVSMAIVAYGN